MNALEILSGVNIKVVGARGIDGLPLPMLGMRPQHLVLDLRGGDLKPLSPLEQALVHAGFTQLVPSDGVPDPHPDWKFSLPTKTSYTATYEGQVQLSNNLPTPEMWHALVREAGWCLLVLQREPGPEVRGQELLAEMDAGNTFALKARLE
ncbi:hypothetical protein [Streptomyces sp. NBC_01451]|uniref:hypothetical protein n=1 Tax=Streptomyces sp. NBC_01451 TaxID=2903872 RepID=UPI002E36003B|nr:hypothetical protein [Streptomyces sp. NBC_01451]